MQDLEPVTTSLTDTYLERVTPGVRFANFLIDMIVFCIIMFADAVFYLWIDWMAGDNDYIIESWGISIGDILFCLFVLITFIAYYTIMEAVWGRTIGKLTLGCKVVMNNGIRITAKTALLRTLIRLIPFDFFTGLEEQPWHDRWTGTQVVKVRQY